MKVPLSWLREFAPLEGDADEIGAQLTSLGMELEGVEQIGEGLDGVVVAQVRSVRPHPDADRIRLVDVDAGDGRELQVCCGASNMAPGDLVPLATVGTTMPDGLRIERRRMRGQESNGMLCSAAELRLGGDASGILILPGAPEPGDPLADALGIRPDVVFEFDALPNRPDTLSVLGVARDLAAHQGVELHVPSPDPATSGSPAAELCAVEILDPVLCGRFTARVLRGVAVAPSPDWLARRLLACGMRPVNNVVDVSNLVMLELGQPNHTYDLARVPGGALRVRRAHAAESVETLDGTVRVLEPADGVIADAEDTPIGIAGVMGGASTEISDSTTDVLLELAWWDPASVAATSSRLGLHSEASLRFKRGVDPEVADLAARRVAELLEEVSSATVAPGSVVAHGEVPPPAVVRLRPARASSLLGEELTPQDLTRLLEPIGFACRPDGDDLSVTVPPWRPDCSVEVDVIEEAARHHGYDRITPTVPRSPHTGGLTARQQDRRRLRRTLVARGVSEAMPMPFLAPGDLERCGLDATGLLIANPLAAEESVLRTSLRPGLLAAVANNANHRQVGVSLFEVGRVFRNDGGVLTDPEESARAGTVLVGESEHLGVVLAGREAPAAVELCDVLVAAAGRGPLELEASELAGLHPGRSARVVVAGLDVGQVGEVHPVVTEALGIAERVAWLQLDLSVVLGLEAPVPRARPVSRFPSTDVDLAFVVGPELPASRVRAGLQEAAAPLLAQVDLFDVFRSESLVGGDRSLAFRVRLQAVDRTLTDAEVAGVRRAMIDAAADLGAVLRG